MLQCFETFYKKIGKEFKELKTQMNPSRTAQNNDIIFHLKHVNYICKNKDMYDFKILKEALIIFEI